MTSWICDAQPHFWHKMQGWGREGSSPLFPWKPLFSKWFWFKIFTKWDSRMEWNRWIKELLISFPKKLQHSRSWLGLNTEKGNLERGSIFSALNYDPRPKLAKAFQFGKRRGESPFSLWYHDVEYRNNIFLLILPVQFKVTKHLFLFNTIP